MESDEHGASISVGEDEQTATPTDTTASQDRSPDLQTSGELTLVEMLHDFNNVLVCVLLNAQIMESKLPSYSQLRRNLHEVERSALHGGVLVQRLRNWFQERRHDLQQ